jgi:putative DNA methylase
MTEITARPGADPRAAPDAPPRPRLLIERWLPVAELGVESQRERGASSSLPPLYFLHVWWARRPLVVSRAAVLGSLLPAWRADWPEELRRRFPTEGSYHAWFRRLLGILGDPVAARKLIAYANEHGRKLQGNPYGYGRAFTINPSLEDLQLLRELLVSCWGTGDLAVLDPTAGGGSIPFEALRFGFAVWANELNPVASVILAATLDYPARFGDSFAQIIRSWGTRLVEAVEPCLEIVYPRDPNGVIFAYLWARTVACPVTGKPVPLSPNWWLQKGSDPVAVRVLCRPDWPECRFEIVRGTAALRANPDQGTIRRGVAISPWTGDVIDGDYIKREAQAGRMGQQLYAIRLQKPTGYEFRPPTEADLAAVAAAEAELQRKLPAWLAQGVVPDEEIPVGNKTSEPLRYGMTRWRDLFAPRQLLALGTVVETLRALAPEIEAALPPDQARAVRTYLALAVDKLLNYNSRMSVWHPLRATMANTFDRHDFSMKWSHAEMALVVAGKGLDWAIDQVVDAYREIARLAQPARSFLWLQAGPDQPPTLRITRDDAARLSHITTGSVHLVCIDPPYYDNVQYAELSDYFYVWLKRTAGDLYPDWFRAELADKDDEAVANPARFAGLGQKARELARRDYERKMAAIFRECHRVLRPDGVLTVMFTHKEVEAWDTLATALIDAGFHIEASWPVHTESEHSLHQAKKNAAASTILLACRKRRAGGEPVWWEDLKGTVRRVARERATEFAAQGIGGVDLYISTFGPVLSVISARWPVLTSEVDAQTGQPRPLRPEVALDLARQVVIGLRKEGLLLGRQVQFDPATDWYLMAWDSFKAEEFPADEARKLALVLGLELEDDLVRKMRLIAKKQSTVVLQPPRARRRAGLVDPDAAFFGSWIDAAQTAMLVYEEDGARACEQFLKRTGLLHDGTFKACLQALINAIPRTRVRGAFARPEAETLERLRLAFFEDLVVPAEEAPPPFAQGVLLAAGEDDAAVAEGEGGEDGEEP